MRHGRTRVLGLNLILVALLVLGACVRAGSAPPLRDDTQDNDHADRGMTKSDSM